MRQEFNWFKWYTPRVRIFSHVVFWLTITLLSFLNYNRLADDNSTWLFVGKDLLVTGSLFYSASFLISKWATSGKLYLLFLLLIFAYVWWASWTYIASYFAHAYVSVGDTRVSRYVNFFLDGGYFKLFTMDKFSVLVLDFVFIVSLPMAPKLTKLVMESSLKAMRLERDNLTLEKSVWEKSLEMVKLERDNVSLELDFLKSQISPHFLFNTLNSIYRMSETHDPQTSETVLRLSNLLRYILYQSKNRKILLSEEIGFMQDFIELGRLRFGSKVPIRTEIADIQEPYKIVPLLFIPFLENAFKHGPDRSLANAWINIILSSSEKDLNFTVINGVNRSARTPVSGGLGLETVRRRLELYYPGRHSLNVDWDDDSFSINLTVVMKN